jgi:hypothetical protein
LRIDFDHAHLYASDAAATVRFFRDMFGAGVVWDQEVAGARGIRLRLGRAFLMIYDQRPAAPRAGSFDYVMVAGPDDLLIELFQCHEPARWGIAGGAGDG